MNKVRCIFKYIEVFLITLTLLTAMLVLSALIPRNAIKENTKKSAEYLCDGELFGMTVKGVNGSKIDRYADSILLAIAYQYDSKEPLKSIMWSSYYHIDTENENVNLLSAVNNGYEPNQQYLRYWHGSNAIVRPLLTVFSIEQIYVLNAVVLAVLTIILVVVLLKKKEYVLTVGVLLGLVLTSSWFVPLSLEYTWTYMLMLLMSVAVVILAYKIGWKPMGIFFMVAGMITNYMDFLTTETLTLLVPLLIVIWIDIRKNHSLPSGILKNSAKTVIAWGCGYAGMWIMKWIMASVVLRENVMPYVSSNIEERLSGDVGVSLIQQLWGAVYRNVSCLFPFEYGAIGAIIGVMLVILAVYIGFVYRKKSFNKYYIGIFVIVGLVPYIRYLILLNHSYLHCFFTYRAQMATILAIVLILGEMVEWRWFANANTGKRKR
ncbi:MAG: hypothetical protein E7266_06950 [Lachnospiraceae bacterium]|nr:hypothetical protein [Lachnospiraceae bacterium]